MIFSKGDIQSISLIREALQDFYDLSSLKASQEKSNIFLSGVSQDVKEGILRVLCFNIGKLPVKYLGVPLSSTKPNKQTCSFLIERFSKRINHWTCKTLSYAGRIQLVKNVLFSIQVYWSSMFILPKSILKELKM